MRDVNSIHAVIIIFFLIAASSISGSQECTNQVVNSSLTSPTAVNLSCSSLIYINVTFQSGLPLRINLSDWILAARTSSGGLSTGLTLTLRNTSFVSGSTIVIDAGTLANITITGLHPQVTITMSQIIGDAGGIMFVGRFPSNTSILVVDAVMRIDTRPSFAFLFDSNNAMMGIGIGFLNVTLQDASSVLLQRIRFNATVKQGLSAYPIYFGGPGDGVFILANGSHFTMSQLIMTIDAAFNASLNTSSLLVLAGNAVVANNSEWTMEDSSIDLLGDVILFNGTIFVTGHSVFSFRSTNMTSLGGQGPFLNNDITVDWGSQFFMKDMVIVTEFEALQDWASMYIYNGSSMFFDTCVMKSRSPWYCEGCSESSASVVELGGITVVGFGSQWFMRDVLIRGDNVHSVVWNGGLNVENVLSARDGGIAYMQRCNISSMDSYAVYVSSTIIIGGSGFYLIDNQFTASWEALQLESTSIADGSVLIIANSSLVRVDPPGGNRWIDLAPGTLRTSGDVNLTNRSLMLITNVSIVSTEANMSTPTHVTGITFERLIVTGCSSLKMTNCTIVSPFSTGINFTGPVLVTEFSTLQLTMLTIVAQKGCALLSLMPMVATNYSALVMLDINVTSGLAGMQLFAVSLVNKSWMLIERVSWNVLGIFPCFGFSVAAGGGLSVDSNRSSSLSFLDVDCTTSSTPPFVGYPIVVPVGTLVARCVTVNGGLAPSALWPTGSSSFSCGQCFASVDCFLPLVRLPVPVSIACGSPCSCSNTTVGIQPEGPMCLPSPGPFTVTPPATAPPATTSAAPHTSTGAPLPPTSGVPVTAAPPPSTHRPRTTTPALTATRAVLSVTMQSVSESEKDSATSDLELTASSHETHGSSTFSSSRGEVTESNTGTSIIPFAQARPRVVNSGGFASAVSFSAAAVLPATAFAVQRSLVVNALSQCSFSFDTPLDLATSPTAMLIGQESNGYLRGAVVGNWLLWLGCVALAAIIAKIISRRTGSPLITGLEALSLPGNFITPFSFLSIPTVSCCTALIAHSTGSSDMFIAVISLGAIALLWGAGTMFITVWFGSTSVRAAVNRSSFRFRPVGRLARYMFESEKEWVDHPSRASLYHFTPRLGKIFEACRERRHWFSCYEVWYAIAVGLIGGIMPSDSHGCNMLLYVTTALSCVYVLLLVFFRPYATRADGVVTMLNGLLSIAAGVEALSSAGDSVVQATSAASQYVSLASVGLYVLQVVLPMLLAGRIPRSIKNMLAARRKKSTTDDLLNPQQMAPLEIERGGLAVPGSMEIAPQLNPTDRREVLTRLTQLLRRVNDEEHTMIAGRVIHRRLTRAEVDYRLGELIQLAVAVREGGKNAYRSRPRREMEKSTGGT